MDEPVKKVEPARRGYEDDDVSVRRLFAFGAGVAGLVIFRFGRNSGASFELPGKESGWSSWQRPYCSSSQGWPNMALCPTGSVTLWQFLFREPSSMPAWHSPGACFCYSHCCSLGRPL